MPSTLDWDHKNKHIETVFTTLKKIKTNEVFEQLWDKKHSSIYTILQLKDDLFSNFVIWNKIRICWHPVTDIKSLISLILNLNWKIPISCKHPRQVCRKTWLQCLKRVEKGYFRATCYAIFFSCLAVKKVCYSLCFVKSVKRSTCKTFLNVHSSWDGNFISRPSLQRPPLTPLLKLLNSKVQTRLPEEWNW